MTPLQKSIAEIEANRNEKIKEIAVYDGFKFIGEYLYATRECNYDGDYPPYLTSLDWLHPVAMKVLGELREDWSLKAEKLSQDICAACCMHPINGEYSALFDATVDAIVYLKNAKK